MKKASITLLLIIVLTLSACLFVACGKNDSAPAPSGEVTPGGGDTTPGGDTPGGDDTPGGGGNTNPGGDDTPGGGGGTPSTPTKLATPVVSVDNTGLVSWADIANASGYKVDVNGTVTNYSRPVSLLDGETVKVKAVGDGTNYSDSDWSRAVTYHAPAAQPTKLGAPTPTSDNSGKLVWTAIPGATQYQVHKLSSGWTDELKISTRETGSFNSIVTEPEYDVVYGYHNNGWCYEVRAIGDGTRYLDSDWSAVVEYTGPEPAHLVLSFANDTGLATWNEWPGATQYSVMVYDLNGNFIKIENLPATQTTYQMETGTSIVVSKDNWSTSTDNFYYVMKTAKLATPEFLIQYYDGRWDLYNMFSDVYDTLGQTFEIDEYQLAINDQVYDWYVYMPDDSREPLKHGDVISLRATAKQLSTYSDSDWFTVELTACDHHEHLRYYPYVAPTEQMGGHSQFFKCEDCGAILSESVEDYIRIAQNDAEWNGREYDGSLFSHLEFLDWDTYLLCVEYQIEHTLFNFENAVENWRAFTSPLEHQEIHDWLYDETGHWEIVYCNNCGEYEISTEKHAHTYGNGVCSVCGYSASKVLPESVEIKFADSYQVEIKAIYDPVLTDDEAFAGKDEYIVLATKRSTWLPKGYEPLPFSTGKYFGRGASEEEAVYYHFDADAFNEYANVDGLARFVVIVKDGTIYETPEISPPIISSFEITEGQEIAVGVTAPIDYEMNCTDWYWFVDRMLTWTSSDETVLTIDDAGNMTALKPGKVLVSVEVPAAYTGVYSGGGKLMPQHSGYDARLNGYTYKAQEYITVKAEVLPTAIVTREDVTMTTKNPYQIEVAFTPNTSLAGLSFESSNDVVATVSATGLVTAHSAGNADITVTSSNGLTKVVHVTVEVYDLIDRTALDYDYTDFWDKSTTGNNTPLEGDINLLILPVKFYESEEWYDYDKIKADLEIAFFGTKEFNGSDTVKSFYETESNGAVTINGTVADWYTVGSVKKLTNAFSTEVGVFDVRKMATMAVNNYRSVNEVDGVEPSLKDYDNDGDGYLDGVVIIYAYPNKENAQTATHYVNGEPDLNTDMYSNSLLWASVWWMETAGDANVDKPVLSKTFMVASFDFMYSHQNIRTIDHNGLEYEDEVQSDVCFYKEGYLNADECFIHSGYSNGFHKYVAPSTYIHEMGHMFGLEDYYDTNQILDYITGGFTMQDQDLGSHDPFSRIAYGWTDPYIITEGCTIELNPLESTGDVILLPIAGHTVTSPFDEYLLIDLYTPDGLNEFDSQYSDYLHANLIGPEVPGCRIWHVDSRIVDNLGNWIEGGVIDGIDGSKTVVRATSNTFNDREKYYQLMLLRKDAEADEDAYFVQHEIDKGYSYGASSLADMNNIYESPLTAGNLFVTGDTFDMTRYAKAFYNEGLMDSGEELGWEISFDYVDGERAIITFTKTI
ncbi:MAG: Ig-like domain-containing protein [Clostridia bacterium]|nr:Ig-like domain-containing protein [Clostridia bacterium]